MKKLLLLIFISFQFYAHAQPWKKAPAQKKAFDRQLEEVTIFLQKDTLFRYSPGEMKERQSDIFFQDSMDLVGYGYRDKNGVPYGIWKYYTRTGRQYNLFCEGYYTLLKPGYLFADPEIEKAFPDVTDNEHKEGFMSELVDKMLFTGEWRFYRQGKIEKTVMLENHVLMPYDRVGVMEGSVMKNESLVQPLLPRRKAGEIIMTSYFSPSGYLERLVTSTAIMHFDSEGKPVLNPLQDFAFPL